jgi:hypothetical protein
MTGKLFSSNNNKNSIVTRQDELNQNTSFLFDFLNLLLLREINKKCWNM